MKENNPAYKQQLTLKRIRLIARLTATLLIAFFLLIFTDGIVEEFKKNHGALSIPKDQFTLATFVALLTGLIGLVIAFWREGTGTLISLIGFLLGAFFLIIAPDLNFNSIYFIILIPTALYFSYWLKKRKM